MLKQIAIIDGEITVWVINPNNNATIGEWSVNLAGSIATSDWCWNIYNNTLTLTGGAILGDIRFATNESITINVTGNNASAERIINTGTGGVTITSDTDRTLTLNAITDPAISANGDIVIDSGVVYASTLASNTPAIHSTGGSVTITGTADVTAEALNGNGSAIRAATNITISTAAGVEAHTNTGYSLHAPAINITNGTTELYFNTGGDAFSIASPTISGAGTKVYVNGGQAFPTVAPTITGPTALTLQEGYAATFTGAFTMTGIPTPIVALNTTHGGAITWDSAQSRLDIAAGLTDSSYPVVLTVSNGTLPNATLTFTLTVDALPVPVISITTQPAANTTFAHSSISGSLNVAAGVTPSQALTYQWYRNTTNSNTGGWAVPGAMWPSFTIPANLAVGTHYFYAVVSSTGATPVASSVARVTVNPPADQGGDDNYGGEGSDGAGNNDGGGGSGGDGHGGGCNITAGLFAMLLVLPLVFRRKK